MATDKLNKKTMLNVIKKAYAKAAKEDDIRNKLAYRDIVFSWNMEDIGLWFTVKIKEGKIKVEEGEAKEPDMIFYNKKAEDYHRGNTEKVTGREIVDGGGFRWTGNAKHLRHISVLCRSMRVYYREFAGS